MLKLMMSLDNLKQRFVALQWQSFLHTYEFVDFAFLSNNRDFN